jgi:hypothetical protein
MPVNATASNIRRLTLQATELDRRGGAGTEVRLLWIPEVDELLVEQLELATAEVVLRRADKASALEAFHHPETFPVATPTYDYEVERGAIELAKVA